MFNKSAKIVFGLAIRFLPKIITYEILIKNLQLSKFKMCKYPVVVVVRFGPLPSAVRVASSSAAMYDSRELV